FLPFCLMLVLNMCTSVVCSGASGASASYALHADNVNAKSNIKRQPFSLVPRAALRNRDLQPDSPSSQAAEPVGLARGWRATLLTTRLQRTPALGLAASGKAIRNMERDRAGAAGKD